VRRWHCETRAARPRVESQTGEVMTELTVDQVQLLRDLARGKRLNDLAVERGVTRQAFSGYAKRLRDKLGLRTQFQLGAWAERHGYGEPNMVDLPEGRR
jgi:DNA-binding NarL/FixJ family response regulator